MYIWVRKKWVFLRSSFQIEQYLFHQYCDKQRGFHSSKSYYFLLIIHILWNPRFIHHSAAWLQPFLLHHNDSVIGAVFLFLIQDEIRVWLFIVTTLLRILARRLSIESSWTWTEAARTVWWTILHSSLWIAWNFLRNVYQWWSLHCIRGVRLKINRVICIMNK